MEKELFGKEDKKYVFQLKEKVIKSKLSTKIKKDFMKYLLGNEDNEKELLGVLIYDLLKAEPAIKAAQQCNDISNWVHMVVDHLTPSIKKYSGQQIDLAMELILSVQSSLRDTNYRTVFSRFTEEYEDKGRVY